MKRMSDYQGLRDCAEHLAKDLESKAKGEEEETQEAQKAVFKRYQDSFCSKKKREF